MKRCVALARVAIVMACVCHPTPARRTASADDPSPVEAAARWRLGMQTFTFHQVTFYEALDQTAALGLEWLEAYPGQSISKDEPHARFGPGLSAELREKINQRLRERGVKLVAYGCVGTINSMRPEDFESVCRSEFEFAKEMGIETIVGEPPAEAFEVVDRYCQQYRIKFAIHNHGKPTPYWNPETALQMCRGRSSWIGICADVGAWRFSGVDPIQALKQCEGRLVELHFRDTAQIDGKTQPVMFGTGQCNVAGMLAELARQKFAGFIAIETAPKADLARSIRFYDQEAAKLGHSRWRRLFNGRDLEGWTMGPDKSWIVEDSVIALRRMFDGKEHNADYLWSATTYGDFILELEFKVPEKANSGVFLRCSDLKDPVYTGLEIQVSNSYGQQKLTRGGTAGALYDCVAPVANAIKAPGEWNQYRIMCRGSKISVELNGQKAIDADLDRWTEPKENPDGTPNKFPRALKDFARAGYLGFQDHGRPVWYRNIRVLPLDK